MKDSQNLFNERPQQNERNQALKYLNELIDKARLDTVSGAKNVSELLELQRLINRKKYGLVWEKHEEKVDKEMESKVPVFVDDKKKMINGITNENIYNFLLVGDNLHSLHLLQKTHRGKVGIIYIDPPYNTGNKDFKYNDNYVDSNDSYMHSKWLSFMSRRLKLAKELLKPSGVILISIDIHEFSQLKMLMDEIFGENNFEADFHVETSAVAGPRRVSAMNGSVVKQAEFIIAYARDSHYRKHGLMNNVLYDHVSGYDKHYNQIIDPSTNRLTKLQDYIKKQPKIANYFEKLGINMNKKANPKLDDINFLVLISKDFREWLYSPKISKNIYRMGDKLTKNEKNEINSQTIESINKFGVAKFGKNKNKYVTINTKGNLTRVFRYYNRLGYADDSSGKRIYGERTIRGNLWKGFSSDGGNVSKEGNVSFKNGKKPLRLIKELLWATSEKNDLILDFFAGSGTTGQAVADLNKEDNGNRRFILATNNEGNIADKITYQRMLNVNDGYSGYEANNINLKYLKTGFVSKDSEHFELDLLKNIKSLIELKYGINFDKSKFRIVTKQSQVPKLNLSEVERVYMRGRVHKMMVPKQQERYKFSKVKIIDIPESFFSEEMQEWI